MIDLVYPNNNEKDFIKKAEELGYTAICFIYNDYKARSKRFNQIEKRSNIKVFFGSTTKTKCDIILNNPKEEITKSIKKSDIITDIELEEKNDFLHHRRSGANHVYFKEMKRKNVVYCINFARLIKTFNKKSTPNFEQILGRIIQNLLLSRKAKVPVGFITLATKPEDMKSMHDIKSFLKILGMDTQRITKVFDVVEEKAIENRKKHTGIIVEEGVEKVNPSNT